MKKLKKIDIYTIPLVFVCIATVTLRSFALLTSFNWETMHFDDKTAITISSIILAISVIGFLSYLFLGDKERTLVVRNDNAASYIPAGIVSTALAFMGANSMYDCFMVYGPQQPADGQTFNPLPTISFLCGLLAFLSVGAFFLSIFIEKNDNIYKAAFSLSIVFFLALYAVLLYFDTADHPTNSPNRFVDEMAYLSAAVFFLFEARIPLGRTKWRGYVAFGLVASLLCSYSSIPSLILYFVNQSVLSESIIESLLTLTLEILIFSKLMQFKRLTPDTECDMAKSISMLASIREDNMEEERKLSRAQEINNKEENDDTQDASNYTFNIPYTDSSVDFNTDDASIDLTNNNQN